VTDKSLQERDFQKHIGAADRGEIDRDGKQAPRRQPEEGQGEQDEQQGRQKKDREGKPDEEIPDIQEHRNHPVAGLEINPEQGDPEGVGKKRPVVGRRPYVEGVIRIEGFPLSRKEGQGRFMIVLPLKPVHAVQVSRKDARAITDVEHAFGAEETERSNVPGRKVALLDEEGHILPAPQDNQRRGGLRAVHFLEGLDQRRQQLQFLPRRIFHPARNAEQPSGLQPPQACRKALLGEQVILSQGVHAG